MKKIILILLIMLISCDDNINKELKEIGLKILQQPEILLDLKNNFPEYYSDSLILDKMKEKYYLKDLINEIKEFNKYDSNVEIFRVITNKGYLDIFKNSGYKYDLNADSTYSFMIAKINDNISVDFMFIIKNNKYYLFYIKKDYIKRYI